MLREIAVSGALAGATCASSASEGLLAALRGRLAEEEGFVCRTLRRHIMEAANDDQGQPNVREENKPPTAADLIGRLEREWRRWSAFYLVMGVLLFAAIAFLAMELLLKRLV